MVARWRTRARQRLPPASAWHGAFFRFNDKSRFQTWLLGENDRVVRSVFLRTGHWLLTGRDPLVEQIRKPRARSSSTGSLALDTAEELFVQTNNSTRNTLRSMIRIELPSLPMTEGGSQQFKQDVHAACQAFIQRFPALQPLVMPLRVTVLVVPPKRRAADATG